MKQRKSPAKLKVHKRTAGKGLYDVAVPAGCLRRLVSAPDGREIQCGTCDPFGVVQFCHTCNVGLHQGTLVR